MSERASAPKFTSVPRSIRVAATGTLGSRPSITSGIHSAIWPRSSVYSRPAKSGDRDSASARARRYATSSPVTNDRCGTSRRNVDSAGSSPHSASALHSSRLCANCAAMLIAFLQSTLPSVPRGV
jgi:hypothetical protein